MSTQLHSSIIISSLFSVDHAKDTPMITRLLNKIENMYVVQIALVTKFLASTFLARYSTGTRIVCTMEPACRDFLFRFGFLCILALDKSRNHQTSQQAAHHNAVGNNTRPNDIKFLIRQIHVPIDPIQSFFSSVQIFPFTPGKLRCEGVGRDQGGHDEADKLGEHFVL